MDLLCNSESYQIASPVVDSVDGVVYVLCRSTGCILALLPSRRGSATLGGDAAAATPLEVVPLVHLDSQPESMVIDVLTQSDEDAGVLVRFLVADAAAQAIRKVEIVVPGGNVSLSDVLADITHTKKGLVVGAGSGSGSGVGATIATSSTLISTFEGVPLVGPNSITLVPGGVSGPELLIADGGAFGETSLCDPRGCVYTTLNGRRQLVRVVGPGLAMPCGVVSWKPDSPEGAAINSDVTYIAEMCANRVLRAVKPEEHAGAVHTSVFAQLSGGMGPVAVVADPKNGDVYIATYDVEVQTSSSSVDNEDANTGSVHVYDFRGELKGTIVVPSPRITGLAFDTTSPSTTALFISTLTHKSEGSWASQLYRTQIGGGEGEDEEE